MSIAKKFKGLSSLAFLLCAGTSLFATETELNPSEPGKEPVVSIAPGFFQTFSDKLDRNLAAVYSDQDITNEKGDILGLVRLNDKPHLCVISGSTARLPYTIEEEERLLVLTFDENAITAVHVVPEDGSLEDDSTWEPQDESAFKDVTPPVHYRQSLARTVGFPVTTFEADENGHITTHTTTLTDLITQHQTQLGSQIDDNHAELLAKFSGAESRLTSTIKDSIEENNKSNNTVSIVQSEIGSLLEAIKHLFGNYTEKEYRSTAKQVGEIKTDLKNAQEDLQNFQQKIFGITVDSEGKVVNGDLLTQLNSLIQGIAGRFGISEALVQSLRSLTQMLNQQDQLPLFYSGSIEHMLFGSARILDTDETKRSLSSMLLKFPEFYDLTGLADQKATLMAVASQVEQIVGFLRGTDLPTFNYILPYLIGLFGKQFPIYDLEAKNISAYCETAEFSLTDYGLYAWFNSLFSCLQHLSDEYNANHGTYNTSLTNALTELNRLFSGVVFDGSSEQNAFPENFLGQNFKSYLQILPDCLERLNKLKELVPSLALQEQLAAFKNETNDSLTKLTATVNETLFMLKQMMNGCGVVITYP